VGPPAGAGAEFGLPGHGFSCTGRLGRLFRGQSNPGTRRRFFDGHLHVSQSDRRVPSRRQANRYLQLGCPCRPHHDWDLPVQSSWEQLHFNGHLQPNSAQSHRPRQIHGPGTPARDSRTTRRHVCHPRAAKPVSVADSNAVPIAVAISVPISVPIGVAVTLAIAFANTFAFTLSGACYSSPNAPAKCSRNARSAGGPKPHPYAVNRMRRRGRLVRLPLAEPLALQADRRGVVPG
jgi:hypothetical protein